MNQWIASAWLALTAPLSVAQIPPPQIPKPTPAIRTMLAEALKLKDPSSRLKALKRALDAAYAANDPEGRAEAEDGLGKAAEGQQAVRWFESAIRDFHPAGNRSREGAALRCRMRARRFS